MNARDIDAACARLRVALSEWRETDYKEPFVSTEVLTALLDERERLQAALVPYVEPRLRQLAKEWHWERTQLVGFVCHLGLNAEFHALSRIRRALLGRPPR